MTRFCQTVGLVLALLLGTSEGPVRAAKKGKCLEWSTEAVSVQKCARWSSVDHCAQWTFEMKNQKVCVQREGGISELMTRERPMFLPPAHWPVAGTHADSVDQQGNRSAWRSPRRRWSFTRKASLRRSGWKRDCPWTANSVSWGEPRGSRASVENSEANEARTSPGNAWI